MSMTEQQRQVSKKIIGFLKLYGIPSELLEMSPTPDSFAHTQPMTAEQIEEVLDALKDYNAVLGINVVIPGFVDTIAHGVDMWTAEKRRTETFRSKLISKPEKTP